MRQTKEYSVDVVIIIVKCLFIVISLKVKDTIGSIMCCNITVWTQLLVVVPRIDLGCMVWVIFLL